MDYTVTKTGSAYCVDMGGNRTFFRSIGAALFFANGNDVSLVEGRSGLPEYYAARLPNGEPSDEEINNAQRLRGYFPKGEHKTVAM